MLVVVQLDDDREIAAIAGPFTSSKEAQDWLVNVEAPRVSSDEYCQPLDGSSIGEFKLTQEGGCFCPYGYPAWQIWKIKEPS